MNPNLVYETFIRRAQKCDRFEKGANTDIWQHLMGKWFDYQDANPSVKQKKQKEFLIDFEDNVKGFIYEAFDSAIIRTVDINHKKLLEDLRGYSMSYQNPKDLNLL